MYIFMLPRIMHFPRLIPNSSQLAAGSPNEKDGIPKGTAFPLVKGGVNTPTAKSACGALATPPKIY
jgi:hypothetical protein